MGVAAFGKPEPKITETATQKKKEQYTTKTNKIEDHNKNIPLQNKIKRQSQGQRTPNQIPKITKPPIYKQNTIDKNIQHKPLRYSPNKPQHHKKDRTQQSQKTNHNTT